MKSLCMSVVLSVVATVHCYSSGAPAAACTDIYPVGHPGPSQDLSTNPFQLSLSDFDETHGGEFYYVAGEQYSLTLSGSGGEQFRGFLVQARTVADGSPVGVFTDNGDDQVLSSCTPAESARTHTNNALKSSVTLTWTAPPVGSGEITFLFAVVVENSGNGTSVFYATVETAILRPCGLPLYESSGQCVEICPSGHFGNGNDTTLTGTCQQLPADYRLALNATVYYTDISSDTPLNTPVYWIRASINIIENPLDLSIRLSQVVQINNLLEFEGGDNIINILVSNLQTVGNERVFDTSINLVADPASEFGENDFPVELDLTILFVVLFEDNALQVISQGLGSIQRAPDPCDNEPCQNGATCASVDNLQYTCSCLPGYTGTDCEQVTDPCIAYLPCDNQATCQTISSSEYSCECQLGYTGQNCTDVGDPCLVHQPCINGSCSSDNSSEYTCECFTGYTGVNCSINIDDCLGNDCVNGTCIDGVASYTCECDSGYTGSLCSDETDECEIADCNNGTCTDLVNNYMCNCYQDYTGQYCNETINDCAGSPCNPLASFSCEDGNSTYTCICAAGFTGQNCFEEVIGCIPDPCENGATCINETFGAFTCLCPPEWTGMTCSDAIPCSPNPCANGGSCTQTGMTFTCDCAMGWTGTNCSEDIDECSSNQCENGGTCTNSDGSFECECSNGFNGTNCEEDLDFCEMLLGRCMNGVCVEGYGDETSCNCSRGFIGDSCAEDDPNKLFCEEDFCANGGTCNEDYGPETNCTCARGFMGESCEEDDPNETFCNDNICENGGSCEEAFGDSTTCTCLPDTCMNGGSCMESDGLEITCTCLSGFTGVLCETDIDTYCETRICLNGGTCMEGYGNETSCNCTRGFMGDTCAEDDLNELFCEEESNLCENGGTCNEEFGPETSCNCIRGFTGDTCAKDDPNELFCEENGSVCANGGSCNEEYGPETICTCIRGFIGDFCTEDDPTELFCEEETNFCANGGTCNEDYGPETNCTCARGFMGESCGEDDPNETFCNDNICENGGSCEEAFGDSTTCTCLPDTCMNGGSCMESDGLEITCTCLSGFTGVLCETDIDTYCETRICLNGGTCIEGYGNETSCNCTRGFMGDTCAEDDLNELFCEEESNLCENGGTCNEEFGPETSCNCIRGFTGDTCAKDDPNELFCEENGSVCANGGSCNEEYGPETICTCIRGFIGDFCTEDDPTELFCEEETNFCANGGTCNEDYGPETNCTCARGFMGESCGEDDSNETFCNDNICANGGSCEEAFGDSTTCTCLPGFSGSTCAIDLPFCLSDTCMNGGSCMESNGLEITCTCLSGFTGMLCETDVDTYCETRICLNGGNCTEGYGNRTSCNCIRGFTGDRCAYDDPNELFCDEESVTCANGGTCNEGYGPETNCTCARGFMGESCEKDDPNEIFCNDSICENGGSCEEAFGDSTTCTCLPGFSGPICDSNSVCSLEEKVIFSGSTIFYTWEATKPGEKRSQQCPDICKDLNEYQSEGMIVRVCVKTENGNVQWQDINISGCGVSVTTLQLCEANQLPPDAEYAARVVNITAVPSELDALSLSLSGSIVSTLTELALDNLMVQQSFLAIVDNVLSANRSSLIESQQNYDTSSRILESLITFQDGVMIGADSDNLTFNLNNFATIISQSPSYNDRGRQTFSARFGSPEEAVCEMTQILEEQLAVSSQPTADSTGSVTVSRTSEERAGTRRVSYSVFRTDSLFLTPETTGGDYAIGSIIVGVRESGVLANNDETVTVNLQPIPVTCDGMDLALNNLVFGVYDDVKKEWIPTTEYTQSGRNIVTQTTKLGHFGLLFDLNPGESLSPLALAVISYIGAFLSVVCLLIVIITYIISRKLRRSDHGRILINLSVSLTCLYVVFMIAGLVTSVKALCGLVSALFQYFMLVYFGWTAVEAVHLFNTLVRVFARKSEFFFLKAALVVWLVPLLVVAISVGAGSQYYTSQYYCRATEWPFWFGLILPFGIIYVFNWAVFIVIMAHFCTRKIPDHYKKQSTRKLKQNITIAIGLSVLFGLGWGFGLTATSSTAKEVTFAFQVIFSIFVGAQGILIFILHGLRSRETRKVWKTLCVCLTFKDTDKYHFTSSDSKGRKGNTSSLQMITVSKNSTWQSESTSFANPSTEIGSGERKNVTTVESHGEVTHEDTTGAASTEKEYISKSGTDITKPKEEPTQEHGTHEEEKDMVTAVIENPGVSEDMAKEESDVKERGYKEKEDDGADTKEPVLGRESK